MRQTDRRQWLMKVFGAVPLLAVASAATAAGSLFGVAATPEPKALPGLPGVPRPPLGPRPPVGPRGPRRPRRIVPRGPRVPRP